MSKWGNKDKSKKRFRGNYERDKAGERIFVLTELTDGKPRRITFESWQSAKKLGWVKYV